MKPIRVVSTLAILLVTAFVGIVPGQNESHSEAQSAYDQWFAANLDSRWLETPLTFELSKKLLSTPDADLVLLDEVDVCQDYYSHNESALLLGVINSQRTFDTVSARLNSEDWQIRKNGIRKIWAFPRKEAAARLAELLTREPTQWNKLDIIWALEQVADPTPAIDALKNEAENGDGATRPQALAALKKIGVD
jgi:hypothetical protein